MNKPKPTASGPEGACRQVGPSLESLERAAHADDQALDAVTAHLEDCASCRARYGPRLTRLEGLLALRRRTAPEGTFDGFYATIRERIPFAPAGGGMSLAFLDAPRTLRIWRNAALAASLLLVATAGFAVTRGDGGAGSTPTSRPLHDPRERLLEAYDSRPDDLRVRPVHERGRRGHAAFFEEEDVQPVGGADWK